MAIAFNFANLPVARIMTPGLMFSGRTASLAAAIVLCVFQVAASDEPPPSQTVRPADVYARMAVLRGELETLRWYMGKPQNEQPEIAVRGAAPREVYFQALAMLESADRLCFEHTREHDEVPPSPSAAIQASDVLALVEATEQRISRIQLRYGIRPRGVQPLVDVDKSPTDVFRSVVQANRQINLLLESRIAPHDVFQQVTRAVAYSSRLLETFPDSTLIPDEPDYEAGKRPADVYRRLLRCMELVHQVAADSSLRVVEFQVQESQLADAQPIDVHHVASLLVAELAHFHSLAPGAASPREVYFVGRKFPSDCYQRAGILEKQLLQLARLVEANPRWLSLPETQGEARKGTEP